MKYKVCILAAGVNDRVKHAKDFTTTLLPLGERSTLTRIIEKFPSDIEIVIAVGYKANLIKEFIEIAYPERSITIVDIADYSGKGSGPGLTLKECSKHLQCPFIFTSSDTVVREAVPEPNKNWIGVSRVGNSKDYLIADTEQNTVKKFYVKVETDTLLRTCDNYEHILDNAFIGIAGVLDYAAFWEGLNQNNKLVQGELQVSNGLNELIDRKIEVIPFTWFDVGHEASYNYACRFFNKNKTIIKPDEFLYFENEQVIKYFADTSTVLNRIKRAEILNDVVPSLTYKGNNFYAYKFIEGKTLPKITDTIVFSQFLEHCKETIFKKIELTAEQEKQFKNCCYNFYEVKTKKRIERFFEETGIEDAQEIINSVNVPKIWELLEQVDWSIFENEGIPVPFHGDLQPENILVGKEGITLIDWRQSFGDCVTFGDIYYDFAKLHHALIVTHEVISKNEFDVQCNGTTINYNFMLKNNLLEFLTVFEEFIEKEGYDLQKTRLLSALTYLNIAPLHHTPYNLFLFYYGKHELHKFLQEQKSGGKKK